MTTNNQYIAEMIGTFPVNNVDITTEVCVFEIGIRPGHFVVRQFGIAQLGDREWTAEPTDEQLLKIFDSNIKIRRVYKVAPTGIEDTVAQALRIKKKFGRV